MNTCHRSVEAAKDVAWTQIWLTAQIRDFLPPKTEKLANEYLSHQATGCLWREMREKGEETGSSLYSARQPVNDAGSGGVWHSASTLASLLDGTGSLEMHAQGRQK